MMDHGSYIYEFDDRFWITISLNDRDIFVCAHYRAYVPLPTECNQMPLPPVLPYDVANQIRLTLEIGGIGLKFSALTGNHYCSGLRHKGLGSLLWNIALPIVRQRRDETMPLYGNVADPSDEKAPKWIQPELKAGRIKFWEKCGCEVVPRENGHDIKGLVRNLREIRSEHLVLNRYPTTVPLEKFSSSS